MILDHNQYQMKKYKKKSIYNLRYEFKKYIKKYNNTAIN